MLDFQFYLRSGYPEVAIPEESGVHKNPKQKNVGQEFSHILNTLSQEKREPTLRHLPRAMPLSQDDTSLPSLTIAPFITGASTLITAKAEQLPTGFSSSLLASQSFFLAVLSEIKPTPSSPPFVENTQPFLNDEAFVPRSAEDVFLIVANSQTALNDGINTVLSDAVDTPFSAFNKTQPLNAAASSMFMDTSMVPFSFSQSGLVSVAVAPNVFLLTPPALPSQPLNGEMLSRFQLALSLYSVLRENESQALPLLHHLSFFGLDEGINTGLGQIVPGVVASEDGSPSPSLAPASVPTPVVVPGVVVSEEGLPSPSVVPAPIPTPVVVPGVVVSEEGLPSPSVVPVATPTPVVVPGVVVSEEGSSSVMSASTPTVSLDTALVINPVEVPVLKTALEEKDVVIHDQESVKQIAVLPLFSFFVVAPLKPLVRDFSQAFSDESLEASSILQQNTFLYQIIQASQNPLTEDLQFSRRRGMSASLSWSDSTAVSNPSPPDMQLDFSAKYQPVLAGLGRLTIGTLESPSGINASTPSVTLSPLQLTGIPMGTLSSVVAESDNLNNIAQKPHAQTLSSMSFGDFLSIHEAYNTITPSPVPVLPSKPSPVLFDLPSVQGKPNLLLDPSKPSLATVSLGGLAKPAQGQAQGLSFTSALSSESSNVIAKALLLLHQTSFSLAPISPPPSEAKALLKPFGGVDSSARSSALDAGEQQGTPLTPRVNLSASQVIQAINQNIPIHIADFPAFISRALQVQPPTVIQPQSLQVTLSPESLGKITAQFELTAQNTVNIALLSQSALTVNKLNTYLQDIQHIIGSTQFSLGQIMVRQSIPLAKQSQSFDQQSQSDRDNGDDTKQIQRRGGPRRRRGEGEEISIDVTV